MISSSSHQNTWKQGIFELDSIFKVGQFIMYGCCAKSGITKRGTKIFALIQKAQQEERCSFQPRKDGADFSCNP